MIATIARKRVKLLLLYAPMLTNKSLTRFGRRNDHMETRLNVFTILLPPNSDHGEVTIVLFTVP